MHDTPQKTPARHAILRTIALQIMIVIATLGACEAILRVIDLRYLRTYRAGADRVYNYDAELGWFPYANSELTFTGIRTIKVRHNSLGLRDIEPETGAKPTIAFIGDSFVWGYDAEENERFTNLLRTKLPDQRIVNAGVTAYGTDQEYLLLDRIWDRIKPNVIVLMFCSDNDRKDNTTNTRNDGPYKPYFDLRIEGGQFAGIPVPWSRHLYFDDNWFVRHSWVARVAISAYVLARSPVVSLPDPTERLIGMIREKVEQRGAKFLLGLQFHDPQLEAYLRDRRIPYASFDGADHYGGDGDHWTPKGHELVADRLMTLLVENRIVAPQPQ